MPKRALPIPQILKDMLGFLNLEDPKDSTISCVIYVFSYGKKIEHCSSFSDRL